MARKLVVEIVGDASSLQRSFATANRSAKTFTRDMEKAGRGAIAGTGLFRGFGRSIAFASGGFLAFSSATEFLRKSVDAARDAAVSQRSLTAQMKTSGESFIANRDRIEQAGLALQKYGFTTEDSVKALTILDRATGNISKSLRLQQVTADLARAKGLRYADAATIIAKALSGQATALRRAVGGLAGHAKGMDLVAQAGARLRGQAAANTTAADKFSSALFDTEKIVGQALLPTLNHYLESLTKWLERMNESGRLQHDVNQISQVLAGTVRMLEGAFKDLNKVTGSTKNSLKLLFASFVAFKTLRLVSEFSGIASQLGLIGTRAATSAGQVDTLAGSLKGLSGLAAGAALVAGGVAQQRSDDKLNRQPPGSVPAAGGGFIDPKTGNWVWMTPAGQTVQGPKAPARFRLSPAVGRGAIGSGLFGAVASAFAGVGAALRPAAAAARGPRPLSLQGRFNLAELKLAQAQLTKTLADDKSVLLVERAITEQQIESSKTLKDKIKFTQQLVGINNQILSINQQQADSIKQQNQALRDRADAIKSAIIDRLQATQQRRDDAEAVRQARETLRVYQRIGGPGGIRAARLALGQALTQQQVDLISGKTARLTRLPGGGQAFALGNVITINVHGSDSPAKVASEVVAIIKRRERHTVTQQRGPGG